ncbi:MULTISPECIES: glutamine synthetase family protein [Rhizobium]|uniref:Glutamine synthetase n=1 Tax=Rhizobium tropici TaxID=398 RepID=A0A6P1C3L4_RHITR|nr:MULTISPECIES: glutamine synthetase family protein [Rhizobium]AGB70527.1 gamma-glutamylputrescine synthetase [Rhizobium tropici CIAT 899]MBB4241474.1 glutamine synthetase [Rhizobium tropici]MBB5592786.1 glutamine synthetase [Rhizobium tropici]MBB6491828.1 glutamine synthetase [Rhizobium tropici]NEV11041.1 glutamine synthetase [Rhizobium tropici]
MAADNATEGNARIEVLISDMNGRLRGKQIPISAEKKVWSGAVRLPTSTQSLDIWGDDNDDITGLSLTIGDPDGTCVADRRTLADMPWAPAGSKQVLATMHELDGSPSFQDPRAILSAVVDRYKALGLTPVIATELEFYLLAGDWRDRGIPSPPPALTYQGEPNGFQLYDMDAVDLLGDYLETLRAYARAQRLPADATTAEFGPGQFEVNLLHRPDALAAADDCIMLKRVAEQAARKFGLKSTCMAKPYTDHAGSGLHVHASIIDVQGRNVLDAAGSEPKRLKSICAGLLQTLQDAQLIFAPYANSYRRFQPGSFAPLDLTWGFGHRGTAVRIPEKDGPGARIEHRVAGADANPYLMLAAILGGMLLGLENDLDPGEETTPAHVPTDARELTHDFLTAVERFRASAFIADIFGERYQRLYCDTKHKEAIRYLRTVSDFDYRTYLPRL